MIKKALQDNRPTFDANTLSFIPMGGSGEFGCNLNVYHCNGKFLIVDCGIGFPDENQPGLDILLPDPGFLRDVNADIVGMVLTHVHDDHKGAIAALWPQLNCPIYASPFTLELVRQKLSEWDLAKRVPLHEVALGSTVKLAPFDIEFIDTAHSVIESSMLYIKTEHGSVLHTGDWRLDDNPMEGRSTNIPRLKELGSENVLAIVGDSTNAVVAERHPSEADLSDPMADIFKSASGRVIVTTFSHSVPRMRSVVNAAIKAGRKVGMVGRSMIKVQEAARKFGYLEGVAPFLRDSEINDTAPKNLVLLATGSQGEPGSAIDRLSSDDHRTLSLSSGDLIVFSAREIPGNEKGIERVRNKFLRRGIKTIMPEAGFTHASGHAYAAEMLDLFSWVKPKAIIPVHGSEENQLAQAQIARKANVPYTYIPSNGDIIALREDGPEKTGQVTPGLLAVDGVRIIPVKDSLLLKERSRVANEGNIVATIVVDEEGYLLHDPIFSIAGLGADEDDVYELEEMLMTDIDQAISKAKETERLDAEALRELVRLVIRRRIKQELGKRPLLDVHLVQMT
jgi:ribonuclease J